MGRSVSKLDVTAILQHYRHDLMNRLQIVQGYVNMGKLDKVESKLDEILDYYNEERKLMGLYVPAFMLWIIQFNSRYNNFRLTYKIYTESKSLHTYDSRLVDKSEHMMSCLNNFLDREELYELYLEIREVKGLDKMEISFYLVGEFDIEVADWETLNKKMKKEELDVRLGNDGIYFVFSVPCQ